MVNVIHQNAENAAVDIETGLVFLRHRSVAD